ncbi:MAG: radical SAM protein [Firmicutes bacterium]|nr:radical SAM protein [Bacillota bacterium]
MIKIGLHDAEMDSMPKKTFPNYALMKISAYHKSIGDNVEWWLPINQYDKVYSSKVFDFTPENDYLPPDTIKGGTGYGLYNELPDEMEYIFPDYSIYPKCDYAIGFLTRGCPNNCLWCYVPKKEGNIKPYNKWQNIVRTDSDKLVLMDNNILASDYGLAQLEELGTTNYKIDLNQGMDIRLVNDDICKILAKLKWIKYIRFSCDTKAQIPYFERFIYFCKKYKLPQSKVFIYTLIQKDLYEADYRIHKLHKICKSFNIYAQAERNDEKGIIPDKDQLEFAQRYIYGRSYKKEDWESYRKRHKLDFT